MQGENEVNKECAKKWFSSLCKISIHETVLHSRYNYKVNNDAIKSFVDDNPGYKVPNRIK